MRGHACNAYCHDGLHCELVYTGPTVTAQHIRQAYGWEYGVVVDRCDPAREAPPIEQYPPDMLTRVTGHGAHRDDRAWLVYWRHR